MANAERSPKIYNKYPQVLSRQLQLRGNKGFIGIMTLKLDLGEEKSVNCNISKVVAGIT